MTFLIETTYISQKAQIPELQAWLRKSYDSISKIRSPTPEDKADKEMLVKTGNVLKGAENMEIVMESFQDTFTLYIAALEAVKVESPKIYQFIQDVHEAEKIKLEARKKKALRNAKD